MTTSAKPTKLRILLVERDGESSAAEQMALVRHGIVADVRQTAEDALKRFSPESYDAVVTDIDLAGRMSGLEFLIELRRNYADFPAILLTGLESIEMAIQSLKLGANDYIIKPLNGVEDLIVPLERVVRAHQALLENRKLEADAKQSRERLALLSELSFEGIAIHHDGTILEMNEKFAELFGYTREELLNSNIYRLTIPDTVEWVRERVLNRNEATYDATGLRKDGSMFVIECCPRQIAYSGKQCRFISVRNITARKTAEARLRALTSELELAEEHERQRLAADIHDSIGHDLTSTHFAIDALLAQGVPENVRDTLAGVKDTLSATINRTRSMIFDLYPAMLHEMGLESTLEEFLDQAERTHGLATVLEDDGTEKVLDDDVRILLFRTVRELMNNTVKHANAETVRVCVQAEDNQILISFADDGRGLGASGLVRGGPPRGIGLYSIEQRLNNLGGDMSIESDTAGTTVTVRAPLTNSRNRDSADGYEDISG